MDEHDDSSLEAEGSNQQSRLSHRKVTDTDFSYPCEWIGCSNVSSSMNEFNHHLSLHRRAYTRCLGTDQEIGSAEFAFYCHWKECNASIEGQIDDFCRHVFYHTFHQYLKFLGQIIIDDLQLGACLLDTASRNVIPELPEKLMCRWHDCGMEYDNPYIFYSHVAHHCEDYPRGNDPNIVIKCMWEGCQTVTKSSYKLKDHVKSHTQAKVVACPTCGSLFASNTRFIDHYKRQSPEEELKFECSHCNHRFASERILRDHMRHHINHYKCPLCDMTCTTPSAVRDHVRYRHSEERGFQCPHCHFKAKTGNDLRKHLSTHQEKGVIRCAKGSCDRTFRDRSQLFEHYHNDHEISREYECHLCAKRFSRGQYLTVHLKEQHSYRWPSGHSRFRYKQQEDGLRRLQTIRYESFEVSQEVLGPKIAPQSTSAATAGTSSDTVRELFVDTENKSAADDKESSDADAEDKDEDLVVVDLENCNECTMVATSKAAEGSSLLARDNSNESTVASISKAAEGSSRLTRDNSNVGSVSEAAEGSSRLTQDNSNECSMVSTSKASEGCSRLTQDNSNECSMVSTSKAAEWSSRLTRDNSNKSTVASTSKAAAGSTSKAAEGSSRFTLDNSNECSMVSVSEAAEGSSQLTRDNSNENTVASTSKAAKGSSRLKRDHPNESTVRSVSKAAAGTSRVTRDRANNKKLNAAKRKRQDPVSKPETSRKTDPDQAASMSPEQAENINPDDCPPEGVLPEKQRGKKRKKKEKEQLDSGLKQDNLKRVSRQKYSHTN